VITKRALWSLVGVTTATLSIVSVISQAYLFAACAFLLGLIWLILEIKGKNPLTSVLFVCFAGLAVWGSLSNPSSLVMLFALSTTLAAWDLSRFRARIMNETEGEAKALLQKKHLQKLTAVTCLGFVIALPPLLIQISTNFVVMSFVMFLAMIALRKLVLYLRHDPRGEGLA